MRLIPFTSSFKDRKANAHLIAAAPEMLEALEAFVADRPLQEPPQEAVLAHRNWELFQKARAVIKKARGE